MKFISIALASAIIFASSDVAFAAKKKVKGTSSVFKDDQSYWNRVLQTSDNSMPTPPPTPSPTDPPPTATPTPSPTDPPPTATPTPPPAEPCDVEVDVVCTLDTDETTDCSILEEVTELQCTGCAPTTLCFIYTGASCPPEDELHPGMTSCNDFNGGPQTMADITISNGMKMFVDGSFQAGSEFCISDGGDKLPKELFVFINAPEGGVNPTANQLSVIDSSCEGQGLTLLESFGALDLSHYINCNGDHDCFVPVTYTHKVKNDGPTGLTITELDRFLNGDALDLIAGVDSSELYLTEGECYEKEDSIVAECCAGVGLDMVTSVVAEGDDGSICEYIDKKNVDKPIATGLPTASPTLGTPEPTPATPEPTLATPEPTPSTPEPTAATLEQTISPVTPAPTPFMPPPGDECFIQVQTECTPPAQFEDCNSMTPPRDECGEKVFSMGFRYTGGNCENSFNVQDPNIFQCEDYNGGPPTEGDVSSFIYVTDIKGLGVNYFTGLVPLGGDLELTNGGALLGANVNASIYSTDVAIPANLLQTMVIHASCSQVTFLKDVYGAIQLLSFNNTLQGFVACFVDVTLSFSIVNTVVNEQNFTVTVDALSTITNFEDSLFLNLTDQVAGTELSSGETLAPLPSITATIDLSIRQLYTVFTTIQGSSLDGFFCRSTDFLNFTASTTGNPVEARSFVADEPAVAPVGIPDVGP